MRIYLNVLCHYISSFVTLLNCNKLKGELKQSLPGSLCNCVEKTQESLNNVDDISSLSEEQEKEVIDELMSKTNEIANTVVRLPSSYWTAKMLNNLEKIVDVGMLGEDEVMEVLLPRCLAFKDKTTTKF